MVYDLTAGEAVRQGVINNETLGYFMARTFSFLKKCGIRPEGIRFRQHRAGEMAHYAQDCWDAEVETSYGWIEVAGHSDRACFDLSRHAERTRVELNAARPLKEPQVVGYIHVSPSKPKLGKPFKKDANRILEAIAKLNDGEKERFAAEMEQKGAIELKVGQ